MEEAAAAYGRHLGTAFQLVDDVLDYSGQSGDIGKNVGDDLREGKPTLPLIYVMQQGSAQERAMVREAIEHGHTERFDEIMAAIRRTGALDYAMRRARAEADEAASAVRGLPPSAYRDALLYFAAYSIERDR